MRFRDVKLIIIYYSITKLSHCITVRPHFAAQFGGAIKGAANQGENLIGVPIKGIIWLLILQKQSVIVTLVSSEIELVRDLMTFPSLHLSWEIDLED